MTKYKFVKKTGTVLYMPIDPVEEAKILLGKAAFVARLKADPTVSEDIKKLLD